MYEIIKKDTSEIIGIYPSYEEAYKAYQELGWDMSDYAIGLVGEI